MAQQRRRPGQMSASARKRQREVRRNRIILAIIVLALAITAVVGIWKAFFQKRQQEASVFGSDTASENPAEWVGAPEITVDLLTPNKNSRPQIPLDHIKGIVIHYTANPESTAKDNRDYFESLQNSQETQASSHFIVGLDGEVIQCIPSSEVAYASNDRNVDTLSIETCHPDESGEFNTETYASLVQLTGWLCERFEVPAEEVIRHYDVTGKLCPKYFVENEGAWEQFRADVQNKIDEIKALAA